MLFLNYQSRIWRGADTSRGTICANRRLQFGSAAAVLFVAAALCLVSACVSPKYKRADENTLPLKPLNIKFPASPLDTSLYAEISDGGPGSWKLEAFWDEYVVIMHNRGNQVLHIDSVTLTDYAGAVQPTGVDPWVLERESKTLEKRYQDAGIDFARMAAPRVIATAAEPGIVAGVGATGAAAVATATAVALPVYAVAIFGINMHNKESIKKEFNRRRVSLPLTLGPGETRAGSFFFPMAPNPQALTLRWASRAGDGKTALKLHFLEGLHVSGDPK